jgi:Rrf2 family protein
MTLLNRKVDYALLILCYLYHRSDGASAREAADHFGISRAFVANILKDLCQQRFVASQRGVHGGYQLDGSAASRTLAELIDALDRPISLAECNEGPAEDCCSLAPTCPVRAPITAVHKRIRALLESVRLVEIFAPLETANAQPVLLEVSRCAGARVHA